MSYVVISSTFSVFRSARNCIVFYIEGVPGSGQNQMQLEEQPSVLLERTVIR